MRDCYHISLIVCIIMLKQIIYYVIQDEFPLLNTNLTGLALYLLFLQSMVRRLYERLLCAVKAASNIYRDNNHRPFLVQEFPFLIKRKESNLL